MTVKQRKIEATYNFVSAQLHLSHAYLPFPEVLCPLPVKSHHRNLMFVEFLSQESPKAFKSIYIRTVA